MSNRINLGAVKGETGATGAQGLTGASGQDGITPHIENGYWYIGSTSQNVKAKGDTWYKGTGAPTDQGVNGDYYIDTATNDVYHKENNVWELSTNIKGSKGDTGAQGENATSIVIGTITTLSYGESATAELVPLGDGAYQLNLGIPEGEQGEQGIQGRDGNTTAYINGFPANTLNFDGDPQAQIDNKLDKNLGSANAGKILTIDANGNIIASSSTAEDDVIDAYIVGETEFDYDWLSLSAGGEPLTPALGKIYLIRSSGDYYLLQYAWNGTAYEQTGGGDTSGLALKTEAVGSIVLSIDSSTYVVTLQAKDVNGTNIGTAQTIDLPLESVVVNGSYNTSTQKLILTLQNGNTIEIDISDIISGLQNEITAQNKLSADLVDDTSTTNKFTNATEKATWNGKQDNLGITSAQMQDALAFLQALGGEVDRIKDGQSLDSFGDVETALADKQDIIQYSTMPTASASNVGVIVQYIGATTVDYTNGHFYKCVENSGNYGWEEVELGSAPSNMVTTDTAQTITGAKTIPTLNTTNLTATDDANPVVKCLSYNTSYLTGAYRGIETTYDKISYVYGSSTSSYVPVGYLQFAPNLAHEYASMSYYTRNSNGTMVEYLSTDWLQIYLTGDQIISKISANSLINGQVVTCIADSTDANTTYNAKHIYRFTYANDTWTATDITPSGSSAPIVLTNTSASTWVADGTYTDYGYKCVLSVSGVTANDLAEVVFGVAEATSGNYAPVVETGTDTITIYSKVDTAITIPTIKVDRL